MKCPVNAYFMFYILINIIISNILKDVYPELNLHKATYVNYHYQVHVY
jgi:hypothetical protein